MRKSLFALILFLFLTLMWGAPARAQNAISGGAISGLVTDQQGGALPGVTVAATNEGTGVKQTTTTNVTGLYTFPALSVGSYTLTFSRGGFKTVEIQHVVVHIGQTGSENATLPVGSLAQSVQVTAQAPLLRPTESSVSTVVNQHLIENLPLSGRRFTDFVLLTPNATADGQFGLVSIAGQQGGADSGYANGNGSNSFTVDGANATSNYFGDARGRTRVPYIFWRAVRAGVPSGRESLFGSVWRCRDGFYQYGHQIGHGHVPRRRVLLQPQLRHRRQRRG